MRNLIGIIIAVSFIFASAGSVRADDDNVVLIELEGEKKGTVIVSPGGSFAQSFKGHAISEGLTAVTGQPADPLTLAPQDELFLSSLGTESAIRSSMNYKGPLSVLLDNDAKSIYWVAGHGDPPSTITVDFYANDGSLVHSEIKNILPDYFKYTFSGFGTFRGFTIHSNTDSAGMQYYHFEYELASE